MSQDECYGSNWVAGNPCIREQGRTPKIIKWTEIFLCFIHIFPLIFIGYLI